MKQTPKAIESRVRRALASMGLALRKSRQRHISAYNYSGYQVVDPDTNCVVDGARFDLTLEQIADVLDGPNQAAKLAR